MRSSISHVISCVASSQSTFTVRISFPLSCLTWESRILTGPTPSFRLSEPKSLMEKTQGIQSPLTQNSHLRHYFYTLYPWMCLFALISPSPSIITLSIRTTYVVTFLLIWQSIHLMSQIKLVSLASHPTYDVPSTLGLNRGPGWQVSTTSYELPRYKTLKTLYSHHQISFPFFFLRTLPYQCNHPSSTSTYL